MPVITVATQARGAGKTSLVENLGAIAAMEGKQVLVVDCGYEPALTLSLAREKESIRITLADVIMWRLMIPVVETRIQNFHLVPGNYLLHHLGPALQSKIRRETYLKFMLSSAKEKYDLILIDAPHEPGAIQENCIYAADAVLVPVNALDLKAGGLSARALLDDLLELENETGSGGRVKLLVPMFLGKEDDPKEFGNKLHLQCRNWPSKAAIHRAEVDPEEDSDNQEWDVLTRVSADPTGPLAQEYRSILKDVLEQLEPLPVRY